MWRISTPSTISAASPQPGCSFQQSGAENCTWNVHKRWWQPIPHSLQVLQIGWERHYSDSLWNESKYSVLASETFYSREDNNKGRECMVTPILPYFHNNTALQLQWGRNQARELWMLPLYVQILRSQRRGRGSSEVCFLKSLIKDKFTKLNLWKFFFLFDSQTPLPIKEKRRALLCWDKMRSAETKLLTRLPGCPRLLLHLATQGPSFYCLSLEIFILWVQRTFGCA